MCEGISKSKSGKKFSKMILLKEKNINKCLTKNDIGPFYEAF